MMKNQILYILFIGVLYLVALLPLRLLYFISDIIYIVVYYCYKYRCCTVRENLLRAFPEKDIDEIKSIEHKFYHHLCDCIIETIKLLHFSDKQINKHIEVFNSELVDQAINNGHSVILFLGHYGNWEWCQAITKHFNDSVIRGQIYRRMHEPVMNRVMLKIRSRFNTVSISQEKTFRTLLQYHKDNKRYVIGFIADQRPNSLNLNNWTTFLQQDTAYSVGGEAIGQRTGAIYLYLNVRKLKRGYYNLTFQPIHPDYKDTEFPYTLQFLRMIEQTIQYAPEYWLWSHKRWRFSKPDNLKTNK